MKLGQLARQVEADIQTQFAAIDQISFINQKRILDAFRHNKVAETHLQGSTGYGYNDPGRETLEKVYAAAFGAEAALVRGQIASGTHCISLCLFGILRPGDKLLAISGAPYDTLRKVIGDHEGARGSLVDWGIDYDQIELLPNGELDYAAISRALETPVKMVLLQRSRGYSLRKPLDVKAIGEVTAFIKSKQPDVIIFVDNCYGEFVEIMEPTMVGVDIMAGSLIKNPGGGLAPTGGYVVGRKDLVNMAASRLTAPGIGGEVGPTLFWQRTFFQGLFIAPTVVAQALKGAVFTARLFESLGYKVLPASVDKRTDIVQAVLLNSPQKLIKFCRAVQEASPVDSFVVPQPWDMPGYDDPVIMAAGTFVQGGSLELTADGPVRPPYAVYFQGGLTYDHVKIAALEAAEQILGTGND